MVPVMQSRQKPYTLRLDERILNAMRREAKREHRSLNEHANYILLNYYGLLDGQKPKTAGKRSRSSSS